MVYYPYMASIVGKKRGNATYYYLVESARVNGQPRIVSQEYLGTAEELAGAMRGAGLGLPGRTQHKHFGAVAAAWGMLEDLGVAAIIDEVTRARRSDAGASTGTYLALAALGRLVAPCSKLAFADWWGGTAPGLGCARLGPGPPGRRRPPVPLPRRPRGQAGGPQLPRHDRRRGRPARRDLRCQRPGAGRDDGGVRRRAELGRQLRPPRRDEPALRRVGARLRLRRPDPAPPQRPRPRPSGPLRGPAPI